MNCLTEVFQEITNNSRNISRRDNLTVHITCRGYFHAEKIFGATITLSNGRAIPTRWIGEQHVREDLGHITGFSDWARALRPGPWMGRTVKIEAEVEPSIAGPIAAPGPVYAVHWARMLAAIGHEVRLIVPKFVQPYVKNQKNDMSDTEAIAEAGSRPTMRFVELKAVEQQGFGMIFRLWDLLVRQRTQVVNALRGHLAEFGLITGKGRENVDKLRTVLETGTGSDDVPAVVRQMAQLFFDQIDGLSQRIAELDTQIAVASKRARFSARLQQMPGVGPITAMALAAFAPPMDSFRQGRDFSAWLGLVPRQHSSGGKQRLGRTSKSGQRDIWSLLIIGAMAVISGARILPPAANSWLGRILARKPRMLAAIALANKMARMLWAMITKNEEFRGGPLMTN